MFKHMVKYHLDGLKLARRCFGVTKAEYNDEHGWVLSFRNGRKAIVGHTCVFIRFGKAVAVEGL